VARAVSGKTCSRWPSRRVLQDAFALTNAQADELVALARRIVAVLG
jgi:hypothetical protein